ncbi:MAG: hypothetical protein RLZ61_58 [Planctomycetota bacterium]|jgi:hypothetical protein
MLKKKRVVFKVSRINVTFSLYFFKEVAGGFHQISVSILRKYIENTH